MLTSVEQQIPYFYIIPKRKHKFSHSRPIISIPFCNMASRRVVDRSRSPHQTENSHGNDVMPAPFFYAGCDYRFSHETEQRLLRVLGLHSGDKDPSQMPIIMQPVILKSNENNEWQDWTEWTNWKHWKQWNEPQQCCPASEDWQASDARHHKYRHFSIMLSKRHNIEYPNGYFWTWQGESNRYWTCIKNVWWTPCVHQDEANEPYIYWYSEEKWIELSNLKYTSTNVDMNSSLAQSSSSSG